MSHSTYTVNRKNTCKTRILYKFQKLGPSVETLFRLGGKHLHYCMAKFTQDNTPRGLDESARFCGRYDKDILVFSVHGVERVILQTNLSRQSIVLTVTYNWQQPREIEEKKIPHMQPGPLRGSSSPLSRFESIKSLCTASWLKTKSYWLSRFPPRAKPTAATY